MLKLRELYQSSRRGVAMTETALLCFFIYAPVLMMVIIWGDMTLDKERAHAATSYMAFSPEAMDDADLVALFYPTATGRSDPTLSVRTVAVEADELVEGPLYRLPAGTGGDYSGEPPPFDLQYKLYSLAVGHVRMTYELQAQPDGTIGFVAGWERIQDEVGRYLTENEIVDLGPIPSGPLTVPVGGTLSLETGAASTRYSHYVKTLTDMFNGRWDASGQQVGGRMGNTAPSFESRAGIGTTFRSPFLWELERERFRGPSHERDYMDLKLPRIAGEPGFEMHFGATAFWAGYTYLANPDARPDATRLRSDLYELSSEIFEHEGLGIYEMGDPLSLQRGEGHLLFLAPGDPRWQDEGESDS